MADDGMVSPSQFEDGSGSQLGRRTDRLAQRNGKLPEKEQERKRGTTARSTGPAASQVPGAEIRGQPLNPNDPLASVIALDIIPRLLMGHRIDERGKGAPRPKNTFTDADRAEFLENVLKLPCDKLVPILHDMLSRGHELDTVLLDLMAPVAKTLGEMWERDVVTFVDVTIGVQRMQQVLREVCHPASMTNASSNAPQALLLPAPGETHSFGLVIVCELFRKRGWYVDGGMPTTAKALTQMVRSQSYAIVGFSLSNPVLLDDLTKAIAGVRKASAYKQVSVIVGGSAFEGKTGLAARIGADAAFADAAAVTAYADRIAADVRLAPW
jgi:MerR family transcriptional regulator, light-induced transcriptional regulator